MINQRSIHETNDQLHCRARTKSLSPRCIAESPCESFGRSDSCPAPTNQRQIYDCGIDRCASESGICIATMRCRLSSVGTSIAFVARKERACPDASHNARLGHTGLSFDSTHFPRQDSCKRIPAEEIKRRWRSQQITMQQQLAKAQRPWYGWLVPSGGRLLDILRRHQPRRSH